MSEDLSKNARKLEESVALVTGSTFGMPFEIAAQLAEAGVPRLMLNSRSAKNCAAARERILKRAPQCDIRFVEADCSVPAEAERMVRETINAFGRLDILVNSVAAIFKLTPFHEMATSVYQHLVNGHLLSMLHSCHVAVPQMMKQKNGVIINIASDAAKVATPGESVNGGLLAAKLMFSRALALEVGRSGIRVHCLTPSLVRETHRFEHVMADEFSKRLFDKVMKKARLGLPAAKDVAPVAVFLCRPEAYYITGQGISINGGITAA